MSRSLAASCAMLLLSPCLLAGEGASEHPQLLLSRQILESRGHLPGEVVWISADPRGGGAKPFRIAASYEPLPDPLRISSERFEARLHLADLRDLTTDPRDPEAAEAITRVNLVLADPSRADELAATLRARVAGLGISRVAALSEGASLFVVLDRFHVAVALITLLGSTAFLLALMVIRVDERRETIGILRLLGLTRARILGGILCEGVLIAVAGALVGLVIAWAMEGLFNRFFQWWYDTALVFIQVTPAIALRCVALSVPLGVLAGIVASWGLLHRGILSLLRR